jgi:hypothetical protein
MLPVMMRWGGDDGGDTGTDDNYCGIIANDYDDGETTTNDEDVRFNTNATMRM